jgi:hypothetical protein
MHDTLLTRIRSVYRQHGLYGVVARLSWARLRQEGKRLWYWHVMRGHATLAQLAMTARTDKGDADHTFQGVSYLDIYERYFRPLRRKPLRILEIGVLGGASMRLWKRYFPKAQIYGLDLDPACRQHEEDRITIEIGSQADSGALARLSEHGPFDIVIDDGSHVNRHILASFAKLWRHVTPGGIYVIEDLGASYGDRGVHPRPKSNDPTEDLTNRRDDMDRFFQELLFELDHHRGDILSIHFWAYLCLLTKAHQ